MEHLTWERILRSYTDTPRDVLTRENGIWFYAWGDGIHVYVESGRNHRDCSHISGVRRLDCQNFEKVYTMYLNQVPRMKVRDATQNSSYWYGIFRDLLGA